MTARVNHEYASSIHFSIHPGFRLVRLPFSLQGINSDNGTEFINWHVGVWCARHQLQFTHSHPSKKDDNAHIEQKNWTHVRKLIRLGSLRHPGGGGSHK